MTIPISITGKLTLGHVFVAAGLDPSEVVVLRHTYTADGLATPADVTRANVLGYARRQAKRLLADGPPTPATATATAATLRCESS